MCVCVCVYLYQITRRKEKIQRGFEVIGICISAPSLSLP